MIKNRVSAPLVDLDESHDGAPEEEHLGGVDGRPHAEVEPKAEAVHPQLQDRDATFFVLDNR